MGFGDTVSSARRGWTRRRDAASLAPLRAAVGIFIVVSRLVPRKLGSLQLEHIFADHGALNEISAGLVDRVSDIGVKLVGVSSLDLSQILWASQPGAALVAVLAAQMVFVATTTAASRHFSAGHGYEGTIRPFDNLQVSDDETMVDGDRTERSEPILRFLHQFDSNLGDFHRFPHSIFDQQRLVTGIAPLRSA